MVMRFILGFLILVCLLTFAASGDADSLWKRAELESGAQAQSLFADRKASKVGDIVTVIVAESATASSKAQTQTSKEDKASGGPGVGAGFLGFLKNLSLFDAEAKSSDSATGQTTRSGLLTTTVTALVTKVMPGGNLFIEGTREMEINKEKQTITISGIVRPDDIGPANTVYSTDIAEARIEFTGKGTVGDRQGKGLLRRLLGWLF
jgi:flagellar L-ring protein precursor FlgH